MSFCLNYDGINVHCDILSLVMSRYAENNYTVNLKLVIVTLSFAVCSAQFFDYPEATEKPKKPEKPKPIQEIRKIEVDRDSLIHKMHIFLVKSQSQYPDMGILLMHPSYPILIDGILKKMDMVFPFENGKRGIEKKELKKIGIDLENSAFIGYENLRVDARDRIITEVIDSLKMEQKLSQQQD